jgi:hypothetical protein
MKFVFILLLIIILFVSVYLIGLYETQRELLTTVELADYTPCVNINGNTSTRSLGNIANTCSPKITTPPSNAYAQINALIHNII